MSAATWLVILAGFLAVQWLVIGPFIKTNRVIRDSAHIGVDTQPEDTDRAA